MLRIVITTLGWLGASLVFIAAAGRFLRAGMQDVWFRCSVAGFICLCLYMLSQWRDIIRLFSTRQTRYGSLALASIVLVLGILTAINYIASRQNRRWDLTAAKQFTLSDQTIRILETLEGPVKILVFDRENDFWLRWYLPCCSMLPSRSAGYSPRKTGRLPPGHARTWSR